MKHVTFLLIAFLFSGLLHSNNVSISNVELTNQDPVNNTYQVVFDISWDNSWRTSTFESNWDAVWIFIKFRQIPNLTWEHASLSQIGSIAPAGGTLEFGGATGVMLYRNSEGIGDISFQGVEIRWNYGTVPDDGEVEISVMAIEMVYIPGGSFWIGDDPTNPVGNFEAGTTTNPYLIDSEASRTLGGSSSTSIGNHNAVGMFPADDFNATTTQTLPAAFPKGFDPFYIMKYEITQGQYVAFLNKIGETGAANRYYGSQTNGNNIIDTGDPPFVYETSTPDAACNFLSWADVAAYADWSGLRPMTELEYEKACRGVDQTSVRDGYAWGDQFISVTPYVYSAPGTANEVISNPSFGSGNAIYAITDLANNEARRVGLVSASFESPTRREAGATYYGVMEMSGNLWEMTITVGNSEGRQFTGLQGNGIINSLGNSTVGTSWPDILGVNEGLGTGLRGGSYASTVLRLQTSNRDLGAFNISSRFSDVGGRLVRQF